MGMFKEFKDFAIKGNVVDLAVGVVIGAAFGKIVTSLVDNIIMPVVGILLQGHNIAAASFRVGNAELKYGAFCQSILDFIIIAFVIFLAVKGINSMRKKEADVPAAPAAPTTEEKLLTEIRDLLKK
ncbi:MAG: large conductance mechanosensitive channel protein MscL [Bacteroidota bacterium]|nr:large conductance mechanosensitive channel protein MscL [Bacteroidota bacterium]